MVEELIQQFYYRMVQFGQLAQIILNKFLQIAVSGDKMSALIPLVKGTKKLFFSNYRDYYYLPAEDKAIHKSIGQFVEKKYRTPAKASTCYDRIDGFFIPKPKTDTLFKKTVMAKSHIAGIESLNSFYDEQKTDPAFIVYPFKNLPEGLTCEEILRGYIAAFLWVKQ